MGYNTNQPFGLGDGKGRPIEAKLSSEQRKALRTGEELPEHYQGLGYQPAQISLKPNKAYQVTLTEPDEVEAPPAPELLLDSNQARVDEK